MEPRVVWKKTGVSERVCRIIMVRFLMFRALPLSPKFMLFYATPHVAIFFSGPGSYTRKHLKYWVTHSDTGLFITEMNWNTFQEASPSSEHPLKCGCGPRVRTVCGISPPVWPCLWVRLLGDSQLRRTLCLGVGLVLLWQQPHRCPSSTVCCERVGDIICE